MAICFRQVRLFTILRVAAQAASGPAADKANSGTYKACRGTGTRIALKDLVRSSMARPLSDQDAEDLAAYYASLK